MLPVLLDLKFIKIYTYGVFLVLAFFWGLFFLWRNIKLTSYKEEEMFDAVFIALGASLFFGRLVYVFLNFKDFGFSLLKFILINGYPGMSLMGSLAGGGLGLFLFLKLKKIEFLKAVDYFIAPLCVAAAIAYVGAFFGGVEVGTKTTFPLAVKYVGYAGPRHITGLYFAFFMGVGAYITQHILLSVRREVFPRGFALSAFIFIISAANLLLDKLKQNHLYFARLGFNAVLAALGFAISGIYFLYFFRKEIKGYVKKTYQRIANKIKKRTV